MECMDRTTASTSLGAGAHRRGEPLRQCTNKGRKARARARWHGAWTLSSVRMSRVAIELVVHASTNTRGACAVARPRSARRCVGKVCGA
jgi:hypothetical protein